MQRFGKLLLPPLFHSSHSSSRFTLTFPMISNKLVLIMSQKSRYVAFTVKRESFCLHTFAHFVYLTVYFLRNAYSDILMITRRRKMLHKAHGTASTAVHQCHILMNRRIWCVLFVLSNSSPPHSLFRLCQWFPASLFNDFYFLLCKSKCMLI